MSTFNQNVLSSGPKDITFHRAVPHDTYIDGLLDLLDDSVIGVSCAIDDFGQVTSLALATVTDVVLLRTTTTSTSRPQSRLKRLFGGEVTLVGFAMAKTALYIRRTLSYDVQGVDLSTVFSKSTASPMTAAMVVGEKISGIDVQRVREVWGEDTCDNIRLRAWVAAYVAKRYRSDIEDAVLLRTSNLLPEELAICTDVITQADLLYKAKPTSMDNDFDEVVITSDGLEIKNARYKTRVRQNEETEVIIKTDRGQMVSRVGGVKGRTTTLMSLRGRLDGAVKSIQVVGREDLTVAERARDEYILLLLMNQRCLRTSDFVRTVWFPTALPAPRGPPQHPTTQRPSLNPSQSRVVDAMMNPTIPLVVVQGPPGSGKTSCIAQAVKECRPVDGGVWIAAQSNVAVLNIAEKLLKSNVNFRLVVSKEFHFEWHEHLYTELEDNGLIIRSDDFSPHGNSAVATERLFLDCTVVLCTISMLSNPMLAQANVFAVVPVDILIIDEASQINVSDYIHLFDKFAQHKSLRKVCMFGDPKQLPPYGVDHQAPTIKSIFQVPHLADPYFLDTQYRMPTPIGNFISQRVYGSRLKSVHPVQHHSCLRFVDVSRGREEKAGQSWKNHYEVETVGHLMRHYYKGKDVCVITPYDSQRAAITQHLRSEDLRWDCVYNVDSFQGNEADYVIVSVVRTMSAGFLKSLERMNVMLTRCKKGMIIVTSRGFLERSGRCTLLGDLAAAWSRDSQAWTTWNEVMNKAADLPGAPLWSGVSQELADITSRLANLSYEDEGQAWPSITTADLHLPSLRHGRPSQRQLPTPTLSSHEAFPALREGVLPKAPVGAWGKGRVPSQVKSSGRR